MPAPKRYPPNGPTPRARIEDLMPCYMKGGDLYAADGLRVFDDLYTTDAYRSPMRSYGGCWLVTTEHKNRLMASAGVV